MRGAVPEPRGGVGAEAAPGDGCGIPGAHSGHPARGRHLAGQGARPWVGGWDAPTWPRTAEGSRALPPAGQVGVRRSAGPGSLPRGVERASSVEPRFPDPKPGGPGLAL